MKRCCLGSIVAVMLLGGGVSTISASAADLPPTIWNKAPAKAEGLGSWSGFYLGLGVGFRSTQTDSVVTGFTQNGGNALAGCAGFAAFGGCANGEPLNDTAFRLNSYVGANLQIAPHWVVGIEGDFGFADKATTLAGMNYPVIGAISGIAADNFSVKTTWDASVRGRVGYLVDPAVMLYATGGAAWLHVESTSACNPFVNGQCSPPATSGPLVITDSTNKLGWTAGGGLEAMLAPNWIARGEYRYADYGTISSTDRRILIGGIDQVLAYDLRLRSHTATFGLAYKFGGNTGSAMASVARPAPMAATAWGGAYLGLGLGARSSLADATVTALTIGNFNVLAQLCNSFANAGRCITGEPLNGTALRISPYAGFNWLIAPRWIAGLEGDVGFADKTTTLAGMTYPLTGLATMSARAAENFSVRTTWDASVRGRIGFLINPSILLYGTGGAALLQVESASTCGTFPNALCSPGTTSGPLVVTDRKSRVGWTAGGGIEGMLGSNWLARAEYRFTDFGTLSNTDIRTGGVGAVASYDLRLKTHTATLGLAYKFDWTSASR